MENKVNYKVETNDSKVPGAQSYKAAHLREADNGGPLDWGMSGYIPIFPNLENLLALAAYLYEQKVLFLLVFAMFLFD
jgi:hypothetical protein